MGSSYYDKKIVHQNSPIPDMHLYVNCIMSSKNNALNIQNKCENANVVQKFANHAVPLSRLFVQGPVGAVLHLLLVEGFHNLLKFYLKYSEFITVCLKCSEFTTVYLKCSEFTTVYLKCSEFDMIHSSYNKGESYSWIHM